MGWNGNFEPVFTGVTSSSDVKRRTGREGRDREVEGGTEGEEFLEGLRRGEKSLESRVRFRACAGGDDQYESSRRSEHDQLTLKSYESGIVKNLELNFVVRSVPFVDLRVDPR